VEYKITHADHILYVDEVGNNTCQKEDGSKGGQKFLVGRGTEPRNACSTSDAHWTTLGFTAGNGEPVLCAIIFASETLSAEERLGIDIFADCPEDSTMYNKENYGPGKYFPGGPRCTFRNIDLPCYVTCSPKGSITSTILADILKFIDDRKVFPRHDNNPTPFLLLDGHGSRLEIPFLSYINNPQHKWVVCIGCPNGTSLWQVGDSSEQNGCYKIYCAEHKRKITKKRIEMGLYRLNLLRTDVIPIVNAAWKKSFAKTSSNLKAIQDRGWGPLNKILLHHPEISCSKPSPIDSPPRLTNEDSPTSSPSSEDSRSPIARSLMKNNDTNKKDTIDIEDINFNEGFAGDVIQTILRRAQRDQQTLINLRKAKKIGTDFTTSIKK